MVYAKIRNEKVWKKHLLCQLISSLSLEQEI